MTFRMKFYYYSYVVWLNTNIWERADISALISYGLLVQTVYLNFRRLCFLKLKHARAWVDGIDQLLNFNMPMRLVKTISKGDKKKIKTASFNSKNKNKKLYEP